MTMQSAAGANGNGTVLNVLANSSIIYTVTMTGFTGNINFEVTEDGTNWDPLQVTQEGTNIIYTVLTGATTTSIHLYEGSVAGLYQARARISNWSAGTATVTAHAVSVTDAPRVLNTNLVSMSTPNIVQKANAASTGSVATLAKAFTSNNAAGNTIIVQAGCGNGTAMTVADSLGNTYTSAIQSANSTTFEAQIFYAVNIASGANTVTVTNAGTTASMALEIYEVSGLLTQVLAQPDQSTNVTGTSATPTGPALAPSQANSIAFMSIAVGTAAQASSVTAGTNWTLDSTQNTTTPAGLFSFGAFSQFLGSTTPVIAKATIAGSEPFALAAAIFKPVTLPVSGTVQIGGYNYTRVTTAATTLVKTGPGILHAVVVNTPTATATLELDDALTNTTPIIGKMLMPTTAANPFTVVYDTAFSTGLSVTVAVATIDATIVWK